VTFLDEKNAVVLALSLIVSLLVGCLATYGLLQYSIARANPIFVLRLPQMSLRLPCRARAYSFHSIRQMGMSDKRFNLYLSILVLVL
jgi:hypothetical protein